MTLDPVFLPAEPPMVALPCPSCGRTVALRAELEDVAAGIRVAVPPLRRAMRLHLRVCAPPRVETLTP